MYITLSPHISVDGKNSSSSSIDPHHENMVCIFPLHGLTWKLKWWAIYACPMGWALESALSSTSLPFYTLVPWQGALCSKHTLMMKNYVMNYLQPCDFHGAKRGSREQWYTQELNNFIAISFHTMWLVWCLLVNLIATKVCGCYLVCISCSPTSTY